ncbi:zinc carboxypeptidase [Pochonia chlamydosporia 170]|uniref:Zinc carboxypeptidase n=1 Tax=Pochonia chlamydosporia 170 TaxID=1380566 RepID=A0A179F6M1_METCM|nr:zinc carboxypeptidase [Pochonia chlamydosporia 170]OAQ61105.1 zinc carboxypeptidase [Pochonia chlamydosporia 170]
MKPQSTLLLVSFGLVANGCLLPGEIDRQINHQNPRTAKPATGKRQLDFQDFPIGKGDRFNGGQYAPLGLGTDNRDLKSILNVGEIESGLKGLAKAYKDVSVFTAPHKTFENRELHGATIGNPRVFIQSGIHARERGGPDNVLYFISDLLAARANGTGISYGKQNYNNKQVEVALSAGIAFLPLVNPDGVAYDQSTDTCWRKNRNTKSASEDDASTIGVDLNRNFAVMWDYKRIFNLGANLNAVASDDPSSQVFHGTAPLSEPETQNVDWLVKQHSQLSWFLDLHSFGADILYAWGDDDTQTTDPRQSFTNKSYDGKRGFLGNDPANSQYKEYIEKADLDAQVALSKRMGSAMNRAGTVRYEPEPSVNLYPTAGDSTDHMLGQYYGHVCDANRIQALTVEFGDSTDSRNCPFYPDNRAYHENLRQVAVGLMELLLTAAGKDGEKKVYKC